MKFLKSKYGTALLIAGAVMFLWWLYRENNTKQSMEDLGILISELDQYQGSAAWLDAKNWDGYEFGDPIPEAVKQ